MIIVADDDEAKAIARTLNADRRQLPVEDRIAMAFALREEEHSYRAIAGALGVSEAQAYHDVARARAGVKHLTPAAPEPDAEQPATSAPAAPAAAPPRTKGRDGKSYPASRPTLIAANNAKQAEAASKRLELVPADQSVVTAEALQRAGKKVDTAAKRERIVTEAAGALPVGEWQIILADPPWRYEHVEVEAKAIEQHYPTMTHADILALPVPAAKDALLFLWATSPKLAEAMEVVRAWGFEYRTCMVWIKDRIGMGYYARQRHELLLICKRGDFPVPPEGARPDSVIVAKRTEHSAKPPIVYDLIERMYPTARRLELFARGARDGWDWWGNQA